MKGARSGAQSIIIEDKIYLIGGLDQNGQAEMQIGIYEIKVN